MSGEIPYTEIFHILAAAVICFVIYVSIDLLFRLPEKGGVRGADAIGRSIESAGGDLNGGFMMGNIVCSPDASAGTLLAACGVYTFGIAGGLAAAVLVFIGNRICHDKGCAGTTGAVVTTFVIYALTAYAGFAPGQFIAGMVIAILVIQGISQKYASRLLGALWRMRA